MQSPGRRILLSLLSVCHKGEERGRPKTPVFQHFFSSKVGQGSQLSPEHISVSRNRHLWQLSSSRSLTFVSCPEQGQLCAALCPACSWEREAMDRKPRTVFLGQTQSCFAVSCCVMAMQHSAKAETLTRWGKKLHSPQQKLLVEYAWKALALRRKGWPSAYTDAD